MNRRSVILDTTVRLIFDAVVVLSVYLLFAGHNQPGGGFIGGLVAACGIALHYVAAGPDAVRRLVRVSPWTILSLGLVLAAASALAPVLAGDGPLDHHAGEWHVELLGKVKVTTALVFDTGVYLIVVGLVLMIFEGLGDDPDLPVDAPDERPAS